MAEVFYVQCPHCNLRTKAEPRHLGKKVRCPHCKQQFVVQMSSPPSEPPASPEPPPPPEPPPVPPGEFASAAEPPPAEPPPFPEETSPAATEPPESGSSSWVQRYHQAARRSGLEPATRLLDLLDIRLKKYLTPWFLRIYWVLTLLWLFYTIPTTIWSTLAEDERPFSGPRISFLDRSPMPTLRPESSTDTDSVLGEVAAKLLQVVVKTILILVGVMFIRIVLEFFIVLFNIAQAAQAVEKRLEQIESKLASPAP